MASVPTVLDPSDVEVEQQQPSEQSQQQPLSLSSDDVEVAGQPASQPAKQPDSQPAQAPAKQATDESMTTAPPSWAQPASHVPEPQMQPESLGNAVFGSPEERVAAAKELPGFGAAAGKPLPDPLTGLAHYEKQSAKTFKEGLDLLGPENFADNSPEGLAQTAKGYTKLVNGLMSMTAPVILPELAANPKVVFTIAKGITAGYITGAAAEKAVKMMGFRQEYQDLANTIGFFIPSAAGVLTGAKGAFFPEVDLGNGQSARFQGAVGEAFGGKVSGQVGVSPEEIRASGKVGPFNAKVSIPRRRGGFEETQGTLPGEQGPPPPPDPAAVTQARDAAAGAAAISQSDQLRTAAQRVQNGQPPVPEKPMPSGMDKGILHPDVVHDLARVVELAGPEAAPEVIKDAHASMAGWMEKQGTVVLPDGKVEVVDSPKKAATVAASVVNDQIDRKQKEAEAAQKTQQAAAEKTQSDQETQQTQLQQRAKTILAANPDHPNPAALLQRNLRLDPGAASNLLQSIQSPQEAATGGLVGSPTHPVAEEPPAQVDAQLEALKKGTVPAVMLPEGSRYEPELPPGMKKLTVSGDSPGAGTYIYDPRKIRPATIKEAAKAGTHGDLLGHVQTKEEIPAMQQPTVLQARQNGQPVQESVVDAADAAAVRAQHDQLKERHPGAEIRATTPEQVQAERRVVPTENGRDQSHKAVGPYHLEPAKAEDMAPGASHEGVSVLKDSKGVAWAIGDTDRMQQKADQYNKEEGHAVQKQGAAEVHEQPHGQGEGGSQNGQGVQPSKQGDEVAGAGEHPKEVTARTGDVFDQAEKRMRADDWPHPWLDQSQIMPVPREQFYGDKVDGKKGSKDLPEIPQEEANEIVKSWKAEAARIGREEDHSNDVIFSLFDRTGTWSKPWRDAGYDVRQYDIDSGDDLVRFFPVADIDDARNQGKNIAGVLAAPPCTSFAVSGARWWQSQHDIEDEGMVEKKYGLWATTYFDTPLEYAKTLVHTAEAFVELAAPKFHVMENPIGRIQEVTDIPKPLLTFDPSNYGDPYSKRTQLWGDFNPNLPTANVEATEGSLIHKLRGDVEEDKARRSQTPEGFAYAFFMANHGNAGAAAVEAASQGDVFDKIERRQNEERRKQVAQMSPQEMRKELLTSATTGLPNRRAFDEAGPSNAVAMSDADGLKAFNDKFGYEAGNELLRAKADALKRVGIDAFHDKGDEFLYRGASTADLGRRLDQARELLRNAEISVTDPQTGEVRQYRGADFSYGTGNDLAAAEAGLKQHKAEREGRGERARGELRGITEARPEPGGEGEREAPAERKYEFGSTQHNIEPTSRAAVAIENLREYIAPEDLAGKGKDIDGNHVTLRYGLKGETEPVRAYLASQRPFIAKLGKLEIFPPSKSSDGAAVLVARAESAQLHRMNGEIEKHGDFKPSDFAEYKPHVTIAYLKPDAAEKYLRYGTDIEGQTFRVGSIAISDRDGNKQEVQLAGAKQVITTPQIRKETTEKPEQSGQSPTVPTKLAKGDAVTFTDGKGNERSGTVAYNGGIVIRIKGEDGKEYTVGKSKVRASGSPSQQSESEHPGSGGRAPGTAGELHPEPVGEVSPGVLQDAGAERGTGAGGPPNGPAMHSGAEPVSGEGAGSGSGAGSDTAVDRPRAGKLEKQRTARIKALKDAVAGAESHIEELRGNIAEIQRHIDRSAAGKIDENWIDGLNRMGGTDVETFGDDEPDFQWNEPGKYPPGIIRQLQENIEGDRSEIAEAESHIEQAKQEISQLDNGIAPVETPATSLADSPAEPTVAKAEKERTAPAPVRNKDWFSHPADWAPPGTERERAEANIAALQLLRDLDKEPRKLTPEDRATLASYVGWGALSKAFDYTTAPVGEWDKWKKLNQQLDKLMSDEEFRAARRSTQNAHYTSPELVRFMWDVMKRFGFKGGNVLEPSMGSGNFFGMMPKAMRANVHAIGNELDPTTFAIAQHLYPGATLYNKDFVELILPDDDIDLAISNVPFGEPIYDPKYPKLKARVHDYFFVKSLDKVKPGGVVAFITSTGTMDKPNNNIRQILASKADFLGAVRLPSSAFKKSAGTEVTTDVILLRKRLDGEQPKGPEWLKTRPMELVDRHDVKQQLPVNEFFHNYPGMMLGEPESHSQYGGGPGFSLKPFANTSIDKLLDAALQKLPRGIMLPADPTGSKDAETGATYAPDTLKEGALTVTDKGKVMQRVNGKLVPAESVAGPDGAPVPAKVERAKGLIGLRDQYDELLFDMANTPDDESGNSAIAKSREKLLKTYQKFTKKFGELHKAPNADVFEEDPHYPRLLALEHYDKAAKKTTLADVFTKRTVFPPQVLRALAPDAQDALSQILAERGYPDMSLMALLRGTDVPTVAKEFVEKGLIYRDPLHGRYETRDKYLSGYVRDKLDDARKAVAQGLTEYEPNVKALEAAQPKDVPITEIEVKLGATWIPLPAFSDFIRDTFGTDGKVLNNAGQWKVTPLASTAEVSATYGTPRLDARDLMEMALNLKEPLVYDYAGETRTLNTEQTAIARQKQEMIKEAFNKWTEGSVKWAKPLETAYNYAMNNLVLRERDGSHLTLPGLNPAITMRPHQLSIIWRGIEDGRYGAFHEVGAGKTLEAIATIMESRRMGLFKKPMLAVPNHLVEQWRNEFMHAYPGAKLLVPTERDFDAKRRNRLMAKITTGEYDAVVVAHSQFNLMDISAERQLITLNAQMDELEETIRAMKEGRDDARSVKQMEKSKEKLRTRMAKLRDLKADKTINFDDLGVDALFVDEAHEYKNLAFYTKMTRVSGLSQADAKRALRLKMKTEYLQHQNKGKGVFFLTGTPLQNTMAEQYTMMKYVAPDVLAKAGIRFFDDWAANFGSVRAKAELGADGRSFKIRNKFSRFTNVPELMTMFHSFGDVKTARDLNLPVPKLIGGKPQAEIIEPSAALEAYVQQLIFRARQVAGELGAKPDPTEDNMLKITSDGRKAATDMRLVYPDAEDDPESKINRAVADVYQKYLETDPYKGTQLVFLDMYRAMDAETGNELINLYHDMRSKWVKAGIPAAHVAIIGDYKSKEARQKLFDQMNAGDVRILLGSTQKMGAGMNVQKLLKYLHDIDNPWRPGDLAQRHGRILRQGNTNEEVGIKHWLTKNSFDTYMLQALESKANFIEQVMNGDYKGRTMEDITGDMSLNLAEMKVATSGNPDVKLKYDLESDRSQLLTLQRGHESQRRSNMQSASYSRSYAAGERADQEKLRAAIASIAEAKGEKGEEFKATLDGKSYTDREKFGEAIEKMEVPALNFHMELNGVGVYVVPTDEKGLPQARYSLSYESRYRDAPHRTMESIIRSAESRISRIEDYLAASLQEEKEREAKAAKLDELAKQPFAKQAELDRIEAQLKEVNQRLGIGPKKDVSEIAEADSTPDELEEGEDNDDTDLSEPRPKKGTELRASLFGLDIAAEFMGKQAAAFWKSDLGPMLGRAGSSAKAAGKSIAAVLYPRIGANQDALDSIMAAKGEMEQSRFLLERISGGLEKFFDRMNVDQHLAFIDRYKLGMGQPKPELQKVEDLMRAIDDESLQLAQQYRPTLTAKENHFRVLWKVIPNSKTPGPQPEKGNPTQYRRPYEGDKGFMKRATLETISEGINYGGVPYTTNPWKLFEMAQASIKKYIAAQQHWANLKSLGLRKFVRLGEPPPAGWVKVDDRIGDVYFKAQSGEGSIHSGRWYLEPSAARILNNFLSRDLIRENPVGNALLMAKNLSTAIELALSPRHFLFESIEAIGSQFGQGAARVWNMGVRRANSDEALIGLREMGSALASPVLYSRAGGSMLKATENFQQFASTKRGQAFLTKYPDAIHALSMLFKGGLQYNMNPDYRFDAAKSLKAAMREGNYIGALLRVLPAMNHWMMYPLFEVYIPRLKLGFALSELGRLSEQYARELANGDVTEVELARRAVDTAENRFGEMNFSNLFWNNTFKSGMQFLFRSSTWKLGNWRGASQAAGESAQAFADPMQAMWEDMKAGKSRGNWRESYTGDIGPNMAWILGMGVMMSVIGTVLTKALSGKWPWEYIPEDRQHEHSAAAALLYEMMHVRTGRRNPYSGQPERITMPVGLQDFEHAFRDPKGYIHSSESGTVSAATDVLLNRDFFGNYVYDPNGQIYQKVAEAFFHVVPKPISVQGLTQPYGSQDARSKTLRTLGLGGGTQSFDMTPLERAAQQQSRDRHEPMTPRQVAARNAGEHMSKRVTAGELRRHIREGRMSHVERLFEHMGYADAKHLYDHLATPRERAILGPMLERKRSSLLRRKGAAAVEAAR